MTGATLSGIYYPGAHPRTLPRGRPRAIDLLWSAGAPAPYDAHPLWTAPPPTHPLRSIFEAVHRQLDESDAREYRRLDRLGVARPAPPQNRDKNLLMPHPAPLCPTQDRIGPEGHGWTIVDEVTTSERRVTLYRKLASRSPAYCVKRAQLPPGLANPHRPQPPE